MLSFDVEFEVYCSCGYGLCAQSEAEKRRNQLRVTVKPCPRCSTKEIEKLSAENDLLDARVAELEAQIAELEAR